MANKIKGKKSPEEIGKTFDRSRQLSSDMRGNAKAAVRTMLEMFRDGFFVFCSHRRQDRLGKEGTEMEIRAGLKKRRAEARHEKRGGKNKNLKRVSTNTLFQSVFSPNT